jgi:hypothetical protein
MELECFEDEPMWMLSTGTRPGKSSHRVRPLMRFEPSLSKLNNGMVIGPRDFKPLSQLLYRLAALRSPYDETRGCGTKSSNHPAKSLHSTSPRVCPLRSLMRGKRGVFDDQRPILSYTFSMDSVRFGRALGVGARAAAKTLVTAVDAATAANPSKPATGSSSAASAAPRQASSGRPTTSDAADRVIRAAAQVQQVSAGLNRGGQQFKQSVMSPVKRLSGVLWLEFTGVFFGLFALSAGTAAWKLRGAFYETTTNHDDRTKLFLAIGVALLFGYFCVSSFLRAKQRERAR